MKLYAVAYAYASSTVADQLRKSATGTFYVSLNDRPVHASESARACAEEVAKLIEGDDAARDPYCMTLSPSWPTIIAMEEKSNA